MFIHPSKRWKKKYISLTQNIFNIYVPKILNIRINENNKKMCELLCAGFPKIK